MRLAPGTYTLLHPATRRYHEVRVYDDGPAASFDAVSGAYRYGVNLDEYVSTDASEPPSAAAGDGPREVLASAGANIGHGWSVSATRTIGNVPERETVGRYVGAATSGLAYVSVGYASNTPREGSHWERYMRELRECAAKLGPLEYRDKPVAMPPITMPDGATWYGHVERAAEYHAMDFAPAAKAPPLTYEALCRGADAMARSSGFEDGSDEEDPSVTRTIADALPPVTMPDFAPAVEVPPSPGPCPSPGCYGRQRRERGEVRVHLWACGCPVRPDVVETATARGGEVVWGARSYGEWGSYHPTRDGAIAAWREAFAEAQRKEDAR